MMSLPADFLEKYGPWAVVTGASSGIRYEFCIQLAAAGLAVVLTARRQERLEALSKHLTETYAVQTKVIVADLANEEGRRCVVNETGDLDVELLINNAGVAFMGNFARAPLETHLDLIALNVTAVTTLAHTFSCRLLDRGKGGIIFVSSTASRPQPFLSSYGGSKAFVTSLGLILREELMPKGANVMVLEPMFTQSETAATSRILDSDSLFKQNRTSPAFDCPNVKESSDDIRQARRRPSETYAITRST